MPYDFDAEAMYRMPTHFGPRAGPRRGPDGQRFDNRDTPRSSIFSLSFLTNAAQLEAMLPPGFQLEGDPVVTVSASYISEIEWLAGRGYNTLGVSFPAHYKGKKDSVRGQFLTVLWENLTDPIITGREELGFSKIYCELPSPLHLRGEYRITASWLGFKFLDMQLTNPRELARDEIDELQQSASSEGILHYKYMPRTGEWGKADIAYATLTPTAAPNRRILEQHLADGQLKFHHARWEDMPTQYNIVNAFADLEIHEYRGASLTKTIGGKDLSDQRILQ